MEQADQRPGRAVPIYERQRATRGRATGSTGRPSLQSPTKLTQAEAAYSAIKEQILTLEMSPGQNFSESQFQTVLSMGRTPIRDALRRLERERFVEIMPRSGYKVRDVTLRDARELFEVRTVLEVKAAALAARARVSSSGLEALESLCTTTYIPGDMSSIGDFLEVNRQFHLGIADMSQNAWLSTMLGQILDHMVRLFRISLYYIPRPEEMIHAHTGLLQAIQDRDEEASAAIAKTQCDASRDMVVTALLDGGALDLSSIKPAPRSTRALEGIG